MAQWNQYVCWSAWHHHVYQKFLHCTLLTLSHILLQSLKIPENGNCEKPVKGCLAGWPGPGLGPIAVKGCFTGWPGLGIGPRAVKGSLAGWLGRAGLGLGPEWRASIPGSLLRLQSTLVSQSHWLVSTLYLGDVGKTRGQKKTCTSWGKDREGQM